VEESRSAGEEEDAREDFSTRSRRTVEDRAAEKYQRRRAAGDQDEGTAGRGYCPFLLSFSSFFTKKHKCF
jgi:hypothetical protein